MKSSLAPINKTELPADFIPSPSLDQLNPFSSNSACSQIMQVFTLSRSFSFSSRLSRLQGTRNQTGAPTISTFFSLAGNAPWWTERAHGISFIHLRPVFEIKLERQIILQTLFVQCTDRNSPSFLKNIFKTVQTYIIIFRSISMHKEHDADKCLYYSALTAHITSMFVR